MFNPLMQVAVATGTIILLYVGGGDVITGTATLGSFVAFQRYINKIIWPFSALGYGLSQMQKGRSAFQRIKELLSEPTEFPELIKASPDDKDGSQLIPVESLELKNVGFQYGPTSVLKDINLEFKKGQFIGITGPVGSGKSTLLHLIVNYLGNYSGQILINGKDYKDLSNSDIWKAVKLVPQEPFLFSASIQENMSLSTSVASEATNRIVSMIDFEKDISSLDHGLDTQVGEKGVQLSGGQKQRVALARGVFSSPQVILLDDTLSALDSKTEAKVRDQLFRSSTDQIRIIVANKVQSLMNADRIIVMSGGMVEAQGTHAELLMKSDFYRNQWELQQLNKTEAPDV